MPESKKLCKLNSFAYYAFIILYFGCLCFLYYEQLTHPGTGNYESDTIVHYRFGVKDKYFYSFSTVLFYLISFLPFAKYVAASVLAFVSAVSVLLTKKLLNKLFLIYELHIPEWISNVSSFCLNFVMAFYVMRVHYKHYIGYQTGNVWHNSTYIFMKFFALMVICVFLDLQEKYKSGLNLKQWVTFSLLLAVATGFKSSFLTAFAPMMAVMLLFDLCRGTKFSKCFIFGLSVIPSLLVIAWQSLTLFDGEDTGVIIAPFKVLSERSLNPKFTVILSVLFPLLVGLFHMFNFYKDRVYLGTLIMWIAGFGWVFFLAETGKRAVDGNFMWGYSIALFFLFVISLVKLIEDLTSKTITKAGKIIRSLVLIPVFAWHVISGIWFFVLLLLGNTYFI